MYYAKEIIKKSLGLNLVYNSATILSEAGVVEWYTRRT